MGLFGKLLNKIGDYLTPIEQKKQKKNETVAKEFVNKYKYIPDFSTELKMSEEYKYFSYDEQKEIIKQSLLLDGIKNKQALSFAAIIVESGVFYLSHPLYNFALKLPEMDRNVFTEIWKIYNAGIGSEAMLNSDFMFDETLYQDESVCVQYKVKALLCCVIKGIDFSSLKDNGKWKDVDEFKKLVNSNSSELFSN